MRLSRNFPDGVIAVDSRGWMERTKRGSRAGFN